MKKATVKKALSAVLAASMVMSMAACGSKGDDKGGASGGDETFDVTIDKIKLGEDYTDIKADLKFLTHKTDIMKKWHR